MFKYYRHITIILLIVLFPWNGNTNIKNIDVRNVKTIVIDAGHGGKDGGCSGSHSKEKHIALDIALYLGGYIEQYLPDVKVIYTRKTDIFIELEERAKIANDANADLFVSIHCNAASSTAHGAETYVMGLHKNKGNLQVAQRENAVIELEDNYEERYNFDPNSPESYIMLSLNQNAHLEQSSLFAQKIQDQFEHRVGRYNRGVKQAGFWVLWRTKMPSVLVESGFLTNLSEEDFLSSTQGKEFMASAIYRAFRDYKNEMEQNTLEILSTDENFDEVKEDVEVIQPEVVEVVPQKEVVVEVPQKEVVVEVPQKEVVVEVPQKEVVVEVPQKKETVKEVVLTPIQINEVEKIIEKQPYQTVLPDLYFKVQFMASKKLIDLSASKYNHIENLHIEKWNEYNRYVCGPFGHIEVARKVQSDLKIKGFTDAFLVPYLNGERASMKAVEHLIF